MWDVIQDNLINVISGIGVLLILIQNALRKNINKNEAESKAIDEVIKTSEEYRRKLASLEILSDDQSRKIQFLQDKLTEAELRDIQHEYVRKQYIKILEETNTKLPS